jgi:serine/threonine protein kinase
MREQVNRGNLIGTTLGQYEIVELIGEGGMATVYKAWQPSLQRYVALKVLALHLSDNAQFVKRFRQEAISAANLKHTHIVTIHDVGTQSGYHYIAMEFIEGTSLQEHIRSGQTFAPDQLVDVISQIGSALDYAHQQGFIHRDIKPANILVDASGRAVLTDFGIVKALSGTGVTTPLTQAGTVFGTPQYMSPEQVKDEPLDHHSDLYALGIVCYEMLSGQVPFDGTTTHSILYAQVNNPPPPLREFSGLAVPPPVEAVVEKMLAKERGARYDSAGEFARDLAQAIAGVWPAGMGGMGTGTAVLGGTPPGMPAPPVRQPMGPPTPTPVPAAARRSRRPLVLGIGKTMPYQIPATSTTSALIIYLLDVSASMNQLLGDRRRIDVVTDALQAALRQMVFRCTKGSRISPRYRIALFAYSDHVYDLLDGVKPVNQVARLGVPQLSPMRTTETAKAFARAERLLRAELANLQSCPAPLVCHMTDGENTGEDPEPIVRRIMQMAVPDGHVLVENIFISDRVLPKPIADPRKWPGILPDTKLASNYARKLRAISSPVPGSYRMMMLEMGYSLDAESVMLLPGVNPELVAMGFQMSAATPVR